MFLNELIDAIRYIITEKELQPVIYMTLNDKVVEFCSNKVVEHAV